MTGERDPAMPEPACRDCVFWAGLELQEGDRLFRPCRRYPPPKGADLFVHIHEPTLRSASVTNTAHWPYTESVDWCGEFAVEVDPADEASGATANDRPLSDAFVGPDLAAGLAGAPVSPFGVLGDPMEPGAVTVGAFKTGDRLTIKIGAFGPKTGEFDGTAFVFPIDEDDIVSLPFDTLPALVTPSTAPGITEPASAAVLHEAEPVYRVGVTPGFLGTGFEGEPVFDEDGQLSADGTPGEDPRVIFQRRERERKAVIRDDTERMWATARANAMQVADVAVRMLLTMREHDGAEFPAQQNLFGPLLPLWRELASIFDNPLVPPKTNMREAVGPIMRKLTGEAAAADEIVAAKYAGEVFQAAKELVQSVRRIYGPRFTSADFHPEITKLVDLIEKPPHYADHTLHVDNGRVTVAGVPEWSLIPPRELIIASKFGIDVDGAEPLNDAAKELLSRLERLPGATAAAIALEMKRYRLWSKLNELHKASPLGLAVDGLLASTTPLDESVMPKPTTAAEAMPFDREWEDRDE